MIAMVLSMEEIHKDIMDMGYTMATPRQPPVPSFYRLADGTILSALTNITHLVSSPTDPNDMSASLAQEIRVFTPQGRRNPGGRQVLDPTNATVVDEDVEYDTLKEDFNFYDLSNGASLGIKTVMVQIQKTDQYNREGEPVYSINSHPVIKIRKK